MLSAEKLTISASCERNSLLDYFEKKETVTGQLQGQYYKVLLGKLKTTIVEGDWPRK